MADYKVTYVNSTFYPIKKEYIAQLNVYDYLLSQERKGMKDTIPIRFLRLYNIYRDWKIGSKYKPGYPEIPFEIKDVPKWSSEQQLEYIESRIRDHTENPYRSCTPEERWQTETKYAVKAKGKKTALRVLDSMKDAEEWIIKNRKGDFVDTRLGECKRCLHYCGVKNVCPCKGE